MTTILADKRTLTLAGDTQTHDGVLRGYARKLDLVEVAYTLCKAENYKGECVNHILRRGLQVAVGTAGNLSYRLPLIHWVAAGMNINELPSFAGSSGDDNFGALILTEEGMLYQIEISCYPMVVEEQFYAIGTGKLAAMAAMHCGKDTVASIETAMLFDIYSGGSVDLLSLKKL